MRGLSCFSAAGGNAPQPEQAEAPRTPSKRVLKRQGTSQSSSRCSTASNLSISKLPPCHRSSDPKIEAMMMPLPEEARASRCLRMSHPRIYSNIVDAMKTTKGCRDWRNFQTFYHDEVDMSVSAIDVARRRASDYERKLRQLNSFSSSEGLGSIGEEVDMIG